MLSRRGFLGYAGAGAVAYGVSQNGTLAYQEGESGQVQAMYVVDRQGVARQLRTDSPRSLREPRISPDGKHVAIRIGAGNEEGGLWIYDMSAGTLTRLTSDSSSIRRNTSFIRCPRKSESSLLSPAPGVCQRDTSAASSGR